MSCSTASASRAETVPRSRSHASSFELDEKIGQGGFATVWKAFDSARRLVAVKVLHSQYSQDVSRKTRFFRGAREMAKLDHPGIVRVLESKVKDRGYAFFVMEYLGGGDLHQAVLAGRFSREERLEIIRAVGEALAHAHGQGVVHRDVKPANILLDLEGRPRLTDFDLVRAADTTGGTRTGTGLGTFIYAAPEALHAAAEVEAPADVYGLGMTAVFAFYGKALPPVVMRDAPKFALKLEAPASWQKAIARAVEWDVEDRWQTVEAFCRAFAERSDDAKPPEHLFRWIETPHDGRVKLWREIPAGDFWMGSPADEGRDSEHPRHLVKITSPFRISAVPVTNAQYALFDRGKADTSRPNHPVVKVSWHDAMRFCEWLARQFEWARDVRLPTEEEWEYATRAGTDTRYWSGDLESDLDRVGWYDGNSGGHLHAVGEKPANAWGLYDVHGNVWEWTLSPWTTNYSGREDHAVDPSAVRPPAADRVGRIRPNLAVGGRILPQAALRGAGAELSRRSGETLSVAPDSDPLPEPVNDHDKNGNSLQNVHVN